MTKLSLSDALTKLNISDALNISAADYAQLISLLDIKFHMIDYNDNNVESMHVLLTQDRKENMFEVSFVHIAADNSHFELSVIEVSSSIRDAISAMNSQLEVDYENHD